jgi:hypothetical protein
MSDFMKEHNKFLIKIGQIKEQPKPTAKPAEKISKDEE